MDTEPERIDKLVLMESVLGSLEGEIKLDDLFKKMVRHFDNDETYADQLWEEIVKAYLHPSRHYHNLNHLAHMLQETSDILTEINAPDEFCFSIFYHDLIYNVKRQDNEKKSAELGQLRTLNIGLGVKGAQLCYEQILATKSHTLSDNMDTNYLTDIDLSILGAPPEVYQNHTVAIRKEYSIYPGFLYRRGRKKVLKHFLGMERTFKTDIFSERYEEQARANLKTELETL